MSDRNDRTSGEKQVCTCQGTCKGADGLGARWQCALVPQPPPLAVGQEVWVRAFVKKPATALEKHGHYGYWVCEVPNGLGGDEIVAPAHAISALRRGEE